jgi:oxalate decarboxylase
VPFGEAHWHLADEWAYMLTGKARIRLFGADGSMFVDDVQSGDLWNSPAGLPHSIQGLEEDGCEFLLVFNQGSFSEESTFLLSDWLKHTPPDVLRKNFRLHPETRRHVTTGGRCVARSLTFPRYPAATCHCERVPSLIHRD